MQIYAARYATGSGDRGVLRKYWLEKPTTEELASAFILHHVDRDFENGESTPNNLYATIYEVFAVDKMGFELC